MEATTQKPTDDLAAQYIAARNQELEDRSQLFVARHKATGLYATRLKLFTGGAKAGVKQRSPR
jgi:hypothetical protein